MTLEEKLQLWVDITGVSPEDKRKSWNIIPNRISDYDIMQMHKKIKETMEYSNPVMTEIILKDFFLQFLKDRKISLYELVTDNGTNKEMLTKCSILFHSFSSITKEESHMKESLRNMLAFYGKDICMEDIDTYDAASLYISAKKNMEKLRTVQFRKGKKSKTAPKFVKDIYLFNSIDEVIKGICSFPENTVMLCYIHDSEESSGSYFCYVIKNEQNIYLMGDMPDYAHPYQKFMSRCPSRDMAERINASFFPYSMAGVDLSCRYAVDDDHQKQEDFVLLGKFSSMQMDELIWNIYMLQFIKEKFFDEEYECDEISYTGNMLDTPLIKKNETALAVYHNFPSMELPVLQSIQETDGLTYGSEKNIHKSQGVFKNVIERFADKVDIMDCQMFGESDTTKLITGHDTWGRELTTDFLNVNKNAFGTKAEIERRQKWTARFNYATKINQLAEKEYKETSGQVRKWYEDKVLEHLPQIIEKAIKGELTNKYRVEHHFGSIQYQGNGKENVSLVKKEMANNVSGMYFYPGNERRNISEYKCLLSGTKGTIRLSIAPYDISDICNMLDISIEEVPVQIRDWCSVRKQNVGNYLIGDYDPMDWVIRDYWYNMNFGVALILSKRAYNEKRKEYGLPEDKFWMKSPQD